MTPREYVVVYEWLSIKMHMGQPAATFATNIPAPYPVPYRYRFSGGKEETFKLPDDTEAHDRVALEKLIADYFYTTYPEFEPEVLTVMTKWTHKDYYLPALKVLLRNDDKFYSPSRVREWVNGELRAEHDLPTSSPNYQRLYQQVYGHEPDPEEPPHAAPSEGCDCGIYGSSNIEEMQEYVVIAGNPVLCIVEPSPDAEVLLCRKGWKASAAFISEIVGETISVSDASHLMSLAWKREINVRSVYDAGR